MPFTLAPLTLAHANKPGTPFRSCPGYLPMPTALKHGCTSPSKNITTHYRKLLDDLIEQDTRLSRSSSWRVQTAFTPEPQKSFSRGFTTYFVEGRQKSI